MAYKSIADVRPQEGKQTLAYSMMVNGKVDFIILGGARFGGKSEILSMVPLAFSDDQSFRGIFFRRQYDEIMGANGLWQKAQNQYTLFNGSPRVSNAKWVFPSGAEQEYRHMYQESDKESHRGKGYSLIGFDEIDQFSKDQVTFLMTCLRSEAEMDSFCVGTVNPNPNSWVLPLIEWYLDETGKPREDRCGAIRYFIVYDNDFIFGDSEEYFKEEYPDALWVTMPNGEKIYTPPKRFSYVFFNIFDNPLGIRSNPRYLSELNNLPDHERDSQLYGNWYSKPKSESLWSRDWIRGNRGERVITRDKVPLDTIKMRGVDKAHSIPSDVYKYPDYTAFSPRIEKDTKGFYYLFGDYHPSIIDKMYKPSDKPVHGRFRKLAGERDTLIATQAKFDGRDTKVVLTRDKGAGSGDHMYTLALLTQEKIKVCEDKSASNVAGKKLKDFLPFANACQQGLVFIVEDSFSNETLSAYYKELEDFNGERSTSMRKDDFVDATAMTFNAIQSARNHKVVERNQKKSTTLANNVLNEYDILLKNKR